MYFQKKQIIALGFFDGVHLGHAALLKKIKQRADESGAEPAVLTFDTHPDTLITGKPVPLINSPQDRKRFISERFGIDRFIPIHFDTEMLRMPWEDFIKYLVNKHGAVHFVCGHDFRFGYHGEGNAGVLKEFCGTAGIGLDVIDKVTRDGLRVSSSYIRRLLTGGKLEKANELLGHTHYLRETVRRESRRGRNLGFPTINLLFPNQVLVPAHGVYSTRVLFEDLNYPAVTNIGVRPTFGGTDTVTVESYILGFEGELYGRDVTVEFHRFQRPEMKFEDVSALSEQIALDIATTKNYFKDVVEIKMK
jgi:riboflavin kinase/FMN adenylyltransferase